MELKKYFASPIHWEDASQFLYLDDASNSYIDEAKKENKEQYVYHSKNNLFFDPQFNNFVNYINLKSIEFLEAQGFDVSDHKTYCSEMWVQEFNTKGGGSHSTHTHWNSHVSGFYFLKAGPDTSYPMFHDPRPGALMSKLPLKDNSKINEATDAFHLKIGAGALVLFNSYLPHEFVTHSGKNPFRFIHFNLQFLPKGIFK
tara:strand:+ start:10 stop:609 length:600 start_codon:yes stop_codon:yes gene_type:complete